MSTQRSQPIFLSSKEQHLFVLHYPAATKGRETIIICPPAPQEIMRAHAGLNQLAQRLQENGNNVIRFDYSGTGDSEGTSESVCLDQWLRDIIQVCTFAKERTGSTRLSLVGLRLGATLAIRVSQHINISRLVLWDPVLDGIDYLREMEASHSRMFELNMVEPPFASWRYSKEQCWGFSWSEIWRSQLAAIGPALLIPRADETHMILSTQDPIAENVYQAWKKNRINVCLQNIGIPMLWSDERYIKIRAFPAIHLRLIQALWETQE